jgi:hypothetical protein
MAVNFLFTFQSQDLTFGDWVSLFTLCLTPLIVHILAGVPSPTCFNRKPPRWHDLICHYNPTSIFWRYLAVADRRCRAKTWGPLDMAATNALFWTQDGWDGSEEMIQRSQDFCIQPPNKNRINLVSKSMVLTIIVALQGGQALYSFLSGLHAYFSYQIALSTLFFPLAILGLVRLPAALWLTNDFVYANHNTWTAPAATNRTGFNPALGLTDSALLLKPSASSLESPMTLYRFRSGRTSRSVAVKCFYLFLVAGAFVLLCFTTFDRDKKGVYFYTATLFTLSVLFMMYSGVTTVTVAAYILLGRCNTTIIPCITAKWYKVYTGILFASTLLVLIFAALETRQTPCGKYTTCPVILGCDEALCGPSLYVAAALQQNASESFDGFNGNRSMFGAFGLAFPIEQGTISVLPFDGWCMFNPKQADGSSWSWDNWNMTTFENMNFTTT